MFNHVMIGSNDLERSKAFYTPLVGVLGGREPIPNERLGVRRLFYVHDGNTLAITEPLNGEPATTANGFTIGFKCSSPEQVAELHDVALANGGTTCEDPPGLRDAGAIGKVHLSYFRDPDGHKLCGFHREG
ncbi:VOC family protein [Novosphingopyxis sp.]|uniref:VOC family protein n=1 Tax=Novosphingopyxis sp. TaxID=2709690 RepID=UPI003B5984BC